MELPDCPPGAEGYQDSVTEVPKKPEPDELSCTKAELEFQDHLNGLKIRLDDGETRCMVERRGRDISGKWIYLCYPCAAVCSGESVLQTHISGKKHKIKLSMRTVWPKTIFDDHPFNQAATKVQPTEKVLQRMAEEVDLHKSASDSDHRYDKYRTVTCHIQDSLDAVKAPLIGVEYLVEHPPEQAHYEPSYICTLCSKQGHPRTIINHMTCFWHRYNYLVRHYPEACALLKPYRAQPKYREGVGVIMNRLSQRIEDKYGRMQPVNIDKEEYEKDKVQIHEWIFRGHHFCEKDGPTFTEVVDTGLIDSLHKSTEDSKTKAIGKDKREPSPPIVAPPSRPLFNSFSRPAGRKERRVGSVESLSDISDDADHELRRDGARDLRAPRDRQYSLSHKARFEPYDKRRAASPPRDRHGAPRILASKSQEKQQRPPNYEYKLKLADEKRQSAEESLKKTLVYHEKNPEKHPLYPEEWKKFWNRRYKEIQAEGKDPSKHDFKPEWIVFWTARMKELHEEELRIQVNEIYRRMCLSPPDMNKRTSEPRLSVEKSRAPELRRKSPEPRRKSPELRRKSPELRRKSPEPRRKSPEPRRKSPEPRRKSPDLRRKSPSPRRRSPEPRRRSPEPRRRSPERRRPERPERPERYERPDYRLLREPLPPRRRSPPDFRRDRRSPAHARRSPARRRSPERRRSPPLPHHRRTRSRSPLHRRSPARTHISLESIRRSSRSPLSQREQQRNRSPEHSSRQVAPSLQTVLISDDELKPDDGLSPWNSDNEIESVGSAPDTRAGSLVSRGSKVRRRRSMSGGHGGPPVDGAADDVVATLRQLVALEDYLGSLGPKIVDLLADALKMEKEKANSSEELLERESAVVLIETAKEKLKGAVQAGLVGGGAAQALRAAVVRAAATLHEADKRTRLKQKQAVPSKTTAVPVAVAGVGEVDRAQIALQMAEALIAQGKTDVSSEDLAVLVDAVVGMAEAKKRAAEQTKSAAVPPPVVEKPVMRPPPPKQSGTASALQMLQSAYDENDKKVEQSNTDAMDGLSDSDLETLLKNFNELSAEEQHSLIAYLKKLEAKEPSRVERLRQYVSEAASTAPKAPSSAAAEPEEEPEKAVVVESDDDDYTVEEVFQSATQKVKENQIRQEMEIVKKSLEESKAEPTPVEPAKLETSLAAITKSLSASSATDLFALVQASIKAQPAATPAPLSRSPSVVVSNTQPRSFGDLPEPAATQELLKPLISAPLTQAPFSNQGLGPGSTPFQNVQGLLRTPVSFQPPQQQQLQQQRPQQQQQQQRPQQQQQHPQQQQQQQQQQRPQQQQQHHPQQQLNYHSPPLNQQNYQSSQQNQPSYPSPPPQQQNYQPPQQNQQSYPSPPPQQQNYQPPQQNQPQPLYNQQKQSYQPAPQHQQHNQGSQHNQIPPLHQQRSQPPPQHQQQYQPPHKQQYQPPQHQQQNYNDNRNKSNDHFNQGQWNSRPNVMDNRGPPMRGAAPDNFGTNAPYNQNPRNNFINGRGQDNYDTRPQMNQQFGNNNYDNNQNNFRGRGGGRGNFGASNRGRGRGYY